MSFDISPQNQKRSYSGQGQHICEVSSLYVKWQRSYCTETTFSQTDRQMDRQPAIVKLVYLHNFVGGSIHTYFQFGEIVEKRPPWRSKIHEGSHFFTTFGSKFNVNIWPVSAFYVEKWPGESILTLKIDPGSHFSTGSLLNVTLAIKYSVANDHASMRMHVSSRQTEVYQLIYLSVYNLWHVFLWIQIRFLLKLACTYIPFYYAAVLIKIIFISKHLFLWIYKWNHTCIHPEL